MKEGYERLFNRCNHLEEPFDVKEEKEQGLARNACIKVFLLLLIGYTIFSNKRSKNVSLIWMMVFQDLDE